MGLFSILKTTPTKSRRTEDAILELGMSETEFRAYFADREIIVENSTSSEDFTLDDDLREYLRKREALYPTKIGVLPVHLWNHPGKVTGEFTADGKLGSFLWFEMNFDLPLSGGVVDVPITMDTVNNITSQMDNLYGKAPKTTDGSNYSWEWKKDGIIYSLTVTWYETGDSNNIIMFREEYELTEM